MYKTSCDEKKVFVPFVYILKCLRDDAAGSSAECTCNIFYGYLDNLKTILTNKPQEASVSLYSFFQYDNAHSSLVMFKRTLHLHFLKRIILCTFRVTKNDFATKLDSCIWCLETTGLMSTVEVALRPWKKIVSFWSPCGCLKLHVKKSKHPAGCFILTSN